MIVSFNSIPFDRAGDASSFSVPFNPHWGVVKGDKPLSFFLYHIVHSIFYSGGEIEKSDSEV